MLCGKAGFTKHKVEGDKTPIGNFKLDSIYFRKDRVNKPKSNLKLIEIKKNMDGVMILNLHSFIIN